MENSKLINSIIVCNKVYKLYENLLSSYVSDFYVENHWDGKLPESWKEFLESLSFLEIGELIEHDKPFQKVVCPLTILCLRNILTSYSISRKQIEIYCDSPPVADKFIKYFWRNVKLKKRHEIEKMSEQCYQTALKTNCFTIADIGSGLGHLSRMLAYRYGFNVCTFEANLSLSQMAPERDRQFESMLISKDIKHYCQKRPIHINKRIEDSLTPEEFVNLVREAIGNYNKDFKFGIVGLHPCGNLGSNLLHLYNHTPNVVFINIASCCYMKLSLLPLKPRGFPLSRYYDEHKHTLGYLPCEAACHAIENFVEKIKTNNHHSLKVHSYRAALECLLIKIDPSLKHCAVGNVKYETGLTLKIYCSKALTMHKRELNDDDFKPYEIIIEKSWKKVVKFFAIRLFLAPLVESIILYDRILFLKESKHFCDILPLFDSHISPRNHVISSIKF